MTTTNNFPSFSDFSRLAMEEAIVKKIKGIIAVKSKFKNISPNGFITSTSSQNQTQYTTCSNPAKKPNYTTISFK
jgi:hypothetical protein